MAKIKTYQQDFNVTDTDKLLGSDSTGATRNYTTKNIADYLNNFNKIGVSGQMSFKFISNPGAKQYGNVFLEGGGVTAISGITKLIFSKSNTANKVIFDFFNYIKDQKILLFQLNDTNIFGEFQITDFNTWSTDSGFIEVSLSYIGGNGSITTDEYYGVAPSVTNPDKTHRHIQGVSSNTWTINHNLNKYPSITVQDSAGSIVVGEITYNNKNTITITFSGAFSGEAHLN